MIKIFHIISHFDLGGAERVAINIAKSQNPAFEYHLIEVEKTNSYFRQMMINEIEDANIKYHRSPVRGRKLAIILFQFWFIPLYLKEKPKIIHTHTEIPDLSIWIFNKLTFLFAFDSKYVRTIHNTLLWDKWKAVGEKVESFFIKNKANIAISKGVQESYLENYREKPPIIYNGIQISIIQQPFKTLALNKKNILFAGRFEQQKGIAQLMEVVSAMENDNRYYFHIVGSGSYDDMIKKSLQDKKNVTIYDKIPDLSSYLASFDYLFLPSNFEGLSLLSIESSFSGTPVIANTIPGLDETLPENWPLQVKNNSVEEYIHIFDEILPNIDYEKLNDEAYNLVRDKFSIEKMWHSYELKYLAMLK